MVYGDHSVASKSDSCNTPCGFGSLDLRQPQQLGSRPCQNVSAPILTSDRRRQVAASRSLSGGECPLRNGTAFTTPSNWYVALTRVHFLDGVLMAQCELIYGTLQVSRELRITATYNTPSPQWRSNTCPPSSSPMESDPDTGDSQFGRIQLFWLSELQCRDTVPPRSPLERRSKHAPPHVATV